MRAGLSSRKNAMAEARCGGVLRGPYKTGGWALQRCELEAMNGQRHVPQSASVGRFCSSIIALSAIGGLLIACAPLHAESPAELMKKGDAFDMRFQATEALQFYLPAEKLEPENARILVRIARQYRHLMADAASRQEKLRLGGMALDYSRRAARLAPSDAEAQLSIAITYGKMLPFLGARQQLEASRHIKVFAEKAIRLNPQSDLAWHVLGRWHRVLADVSTVKRGLASIVYGKLPQTTTEEAVRCFQKAIEINPNRLMHYVELGRAYAQMGRTVEARQFIQKGLAMPDVEKDDPETKRRGLETLTKIQ
jgi:tetratricopeptide (TPR) repeat protein